MATEVLPSESTVGTRRGESREAPARPVERNSRPRRFRFVAVVLAVLMAVAAAWWLVGTLTSSTGPRHYLTAPVRKTDLEVLVSENGTVRSAKDHLIKCKVKGTTSVLWVVKSGTRVKKGDVLMRLDTSEIEQKISQRKIDANAALANTRIAESDVASAKIAVTEYLEGTYASELATKEKELVTAQSQLKAARNSLDHSRRLFRKGYISRLKYEASVDAVRHAELEVKVKETQLRSLQRFKKAKMLEELKAKLAAAEARLDGYREELNLQQQRLEDLERQLEHCVIRADRDGMVLHRSGEAWQEQPAIAEGAKVREDQVVLVMPDLSRMQVKVGVHESKVARVKKGMGARVKVGKRWLSGRVKEIASAAEPARWWNGNRVQYDTLIELDEIPPDLKPGMSVAVEIVVARYENVLAVPVASVLVAGTKAFCWRETPGGPERRAVVLGDANDQFVIVKSGLAEGDRVILDPGTAVPEASRMLAEEAARRKQPSAGASPAPAKSSSAPPA